MAHLTITFDLENPEEFNLNGDLEGLAQIDILMGVCNLVHSAINLFIDENLHDAAYDLAISMIQDSHAINITDTSGDTTA